MLPEMPTDLMCTVLQAHKVNPQREIAQEHREQAMLWIVRIVLDHNAFQAFIERLYDLFDVMPCMRELAYLNSPFSGLHRSLEFLPTQRIRQIADEGLPICSNTELAELCINARAVAILRTCVQSAMQVERGDFWLSHRVMASIQCQRQKEAERPHPIAHQMES